MTTRCAPPDCACDCHAPPRPQREDVASPETVARALRRAREEIAFRKSKSAETEQP